MKHSELGTVYKPESNRLDEIHFVRFVNAICLTFRQQKDQARTHALRLLYLLRINVISFSFMLFFYFTGENRMWKCTVILEVQGAHTIVNKWVKS